MESKATKYSVTLLCLLFYCLRLTESNSSLHVFGNLGGTIEFRCYMNDSSTFTRITHKMFNSTTRTLLSNEVINKEYRNSEVTIEKHQHVYVIRIYPIRNSSAGLYTCEDDVSQLNKNDHSANITLHVSPYEKPNAKKENFMKLLLLIPTEFLREKKENMSVKDLDMEKQILNEHSV